ncbi:DM13 domain-containing protein [Nocardioides marinquilinus]|uniref:DM13 domain-containing protein n=1 Tax=Nocardioides marinquilinus TaxID=1210400 RepID=A0ABP9Q3P2_9ACTN
MVKWIVGALALVVIGVGLWAFEPWRLWTSSTTDEAIPGVEDVDADTSVLDVAETTDARPGGGTTRERDARPSEEPSQQPRLTVLGSGEFEDAEHETTGLAVVVEAADGSRFVRLEDLASSDGPDLHVALSDAPSGGDWGSYDDGRYVGLGELKATHGNQNYEIPDDVDLDGLTTVVVWCDRFNVAFGTADVAA